MQLGNGIYYSTCSLKAQHVSSVTTRVCKPEAANTVGAPDDERRNARNMLSF